MPFSNTQTETLILGNEAGAHIILDSDTNTIRVYDDAGVKRVEIDGETQAIRLWDANGLIAGQWSSSSFIVIQPNSAAISLRTDGPVTLLLFEPPIGIPISAAAAISGWYDTGGVNANSLLLQSPELNNFGRSSIRLSGGDNVASPEITVDAPLRLGGAGAAFVDGAISGLGTLTGTTNYSDALTGVGLLGVSFVAPPSGAVLILFSAAMGSNAAGGNTYVSPRVRNGGVIGAGSDFVLPSDSRAIRNQSGTANNDSAGMGSFRMVDSLTPGQTYNTCLSHRIDSAAITGSFLNRNIGVIPLP